MIKDMVVDHRNRRIRILDYTGTDLRTLGKHLDLVAEENRAGKIILYARESDLQQLLTFGWVFEGVMSGYFLGQPAFCLARYADLGRACSEFTEKEDAIIQIILNREAGDNTELRPIAAASRQYQSSLDVRMLQPEDVDEVMEVFAEVFDTYPSPVEERAHFEQIFSGTGYLMMVARHNGQVTGIISAEIDEKNLCAEITDCVTLTQYRGQGIMGGLLDIVEQRLWDRGLKYLYSLTRAGIPPINAVFHRKGYVYSGRLVNNCNIGGRYESMNIWEKLR